MDHRFPVLVSVNMDIKDGAQISCIGKCFILTNTEICDPSFMFMFTLTNTGNLCSTLYVHVYTYQYRKSMIHPLCSCLHLPIQEIYDPSFMFMFTLTNIGNLWKHEHKGWITDFCIGKYKHEHKGWIIDFLYW
jgi:hypothetical protein